MMMRDVTENLNRCIDGNPQLCALSVSLGVITIILGTLTVALILYVWRVRHDRNGYQNARNVAIGLILVVGTMTLRSGGAWMTAWRFRRNLEPIAIMNILSPYVQFASIVVIVIGAIICLREIVTKKWGIAVVVAMIAPILVALVYI